MSAKALDYATRKAICDQVAETVAQEIRACQLQIDRDPAEQLHGPCSPAAEEFVIGSVLASPPRFLDPATVPISHRARRRMAQERAGQILDPRALDLEAGDFWGHLNGRLWQAMLDAPDPTDIPALVESLLQADRIAGDPKYFISILEEYRDRAQQFAALRDVLSAAELLREHARARRLVGLLANLAQGLANNAETHTTAYQQLRQHFSTARSKR